MPIPLFRQLLHQAGRLARLDARRPQQGNLRRAVSSLYYAFFHFLIDRSTRYLVGTSRRAIPLRHLISRAYSHDEMASAAKSFASGNLPAVVSNTFGQPIPIPAVLKDIAALFVDAQERRHRADYDLAAQFVRADVLIFLTRVSNAIQSWNQISAQPATQVFLIALLNWKRIRDR